MTNNYADERDTLIIKCDCSCHQLQVDLVKESWTNEDGKKEVDEYFEISTWELVGHSPLTLRQRLRWCWRILKTGMPWCDMMVITKSKAKELAEFVNKRVKETE